jgi:TonB family protein
MPTTLGTDHRRSEKDTGTERALSVAYRFRYPVAVMIAFVLFLTNPKPEKVYALFADEMRKVLHEEMNNNAIAGLLGVSLADAITPATMRSLLKVDQIDAYIGSIYVVQPTALGVVGYRLRGQEPETILLCGAATKIFRCPQWIQKKLGLSPKTTNQEPSPAPNSGEVMHRDGDHAPTNTAEVTQNAEASDLRRLVADWNDAHSNRDVEAFTALYDDLILFYRVQQNKSESIRNKTQLFEKYPDFNQQIIGDIKITKISDNKVQCDFTKRVTVNNKTTDYLSYLIFRKTLDGWKIATESDLVTDENLEKKSVNRNSIAESNVTDRPVPTPPAAAAVEREAVRVAPTLDLRRSPSTHDFYPASARRAQIEGVTTVRACVGPDGRVAGDPTVTNSSGTASLDEAAVKWARRTRFAPGTEDGAAVEMCTQFNVRFELTD